MIVGVILVVALWVVFAAFTLWAFAVCIETGDEES